MKIRHRAIVVALMTLAATGSLLAEKKKTGGLVGRAETQLSDGNYAGAFKTAKKAIAKDSGNARAWFTAGMAKLKLGERDEAARYLRDAIAADSDFYAPWLHYNLGAMALRDFELRVGSLSASEQQKRLDTAIGHFDDELLHEPDQVAALSGRARALGYRAEIDPDSLARAVTAFEAWAAATPGKVDAWRFLTRLYFNVGQSRELMGLLDRFASDRPTQLVDVIAPTVRQLAAMDRAKDGRVLLISALVRISPERSSLVHTVLEDGKSSWSALVEYLKLEPAGAELDLVVRLLGWDEGTESLDGKVLSELPDGLAPARLTHGAPPEYPELARVARVQADVRLIGVIRADGTPAHLTALPCGHPGLGFEEAAVRGVRQWRFEPARLDGQAVAVPYGARVEFKLH